MKSQWRLCSLKCSLQKSAALPNSSVAAKNHPSPAALGWAMLPFPGGPAGMSLLGSAHPRGVGTLAGRAEPGCAQAGMGGQ